LAHLCPEEPVIVALLTQLLAKTEALERCMAQLAARQSTADAHPTAGSFETRVASCAPPETASLAEAFFAWYTTRLWEPGTNRKEQATRSEYKAGVT
jgi:hypothetical protein